MTTPPGPPKRYSCTVVGASAFSSDGNIPRTTVRLVTTAPPVVIEQAKKLVPPDQLAKLIEWRVVEITEILEK